MRLTIVGAVVARHISSQVFQGFGVLIGGLGHEEPLK